MILQEREISVLDEAMTKEIPHIWQYWKVSSYKLRGKSKKINRLKTCAICTRFSVALQY